MKNMKDYDPKNLPKEDIVIILISTYSGNSPNSASEFVAYVNNKEHSADLLKDVKFALCWL